MTASGTPQRLISGALRRSEWPDAQAGRHFQHGGEMRGDAPRRGAERRRDDEKDTDKQIEGLLDRIVEASSPAVVRAYEARIEKLEREKFALSERAENFVPPKGRLEEFIELAALGSKGTKISATAPATLPAWG